MDRHFTEEDTQMENKHMKICSAPWLVWLSGLSTGLQTKGSQVGFPVRAHAWVVGQVRSPVGGMQEATTH